MRPRTRDSTSLVKNADKVWWPGEGITKGEIAAFYDSVDALLTPWLRDRPLVAERCPDGVAGFCFYQKNFPPGSQPKDLPRLKLHAASTKKDVHYLVGTDAKASSSTQKVPGRSPGRAASGRRYRRPSAAKIRTSTPSRWGRNGPRTRADRVPAG